MTHGWYEFPDNFSLEAFHAGALTKHLTMIGTPAEDASPQQMPVAKAPGQLSLF